MTCDIPTLITWSDRLRKTDAGAGRGEPRETMYQQGRTQRDGPVGQRGLKQCSVIYHVLSCPIMSSHYPQVSQVAWDRGIPVLIVNCVGMYSEVISL